jgi:ornithine decarboxylase
MRLFAVDCDEEVEKIARAAPGAKVFCRILTDGAGAEWPLSRKFGCVPAMAVDVLRCTPSAWASTPMASRSMSARSRPDLEAWDRRWRRQGVFATLAERGIS